MHLPLFTNQNLLKITSIFVLRFFTDQHWSGKKWRTKVFNWSEVHFYRSTYFLQNPYFKKCPPLKGLRLSTGLCKKDFGWGGKKCILEIFSNKIENIREISPNKGTIARSSSLNWVVFKWEKYKGNRKIHWKMQSNQYSALSNQ